jgi:hypothetical protein
VTVDLLELAAAALDDLLEEVVFVGGATVVLWITDPALATKLEAFKGRGKGDFLGSADFADIVALVDGREELVPEVQRAASELRRYVSEELQRLRSHPRFLDGIYSAFPPDLASQARADEVVLPRLELLVVRPR